MNNGPQQRRGESPKQTPGVQAKPRVEKQTLGEGRERDRWSGGSMGKEVVAR